VITSPDQLRDRTKKFAVRVIRLCQALPKNSEGQVIAKQLLRAGTSVGANYRAACRARSRAEFIAKLGVVVEEADETMYWIELVNELKLLKPGLVTPLYQEAEELTRICVAARQTSRRS
jgi:four helix bundle protein